MPTTLVDLALVSYDTIEHRSTLDNGKAFWDIRTKDNMNIAYGLYIFHVDSNEGSFIGKFAVIK